MTTYAGLTTANRSRFKRFSHGRRFDVALRLVGTPDIVLDVGTGDAHFPRLLAATAPRTRVIAYDPEPALLAQAHPHPRVTLTDTLPIGVFPRITCLEVLEHLPPLARFALLGEMRDRLSSDGRLIVSVPLEVGLAGLLKNAARLVLRQRHRASWKDYAHAVIGRHDRRAFPNGYAASHVGFDYRSLPPMFRSMGLTIEHTECSPLPALGTHVNAQIFWVLRR